MPYRPRLNRPALGRLLLAAAMAALPWAASAQNLLTLYQAAREYDASYQSAKLQYDANLARAEQARAGVLPSANLSSTISRSDFENNNPRVERSFGTQGATASASYPLYRVTNRLTWEQAQSQMEQAKVQLATAEQDLIIRVSQAYFDVLASQDSLTFVRAQKAAVAEQLAAARRNFEVGTSTITDTREAQARFDLVVAQEIAAENDLRVKKLALDSLVGRNSTDPRGLANAGDLPPLQPADLAPWVLDAEDNHPSVALARLNLTVAQLETRKANAGHLPTLDATASYNITHNSRGSAQSGLNSRTNNLSVGLQFNLPLFSGYATVNRIRETTALEDKAQVDVDVAKRAVTQATRAAFFGVQSGMGQVKALEAAELSSQSALDANRLGYQVGVRINIDVLNSQSQLFQTKRDLAQARYNVLLGGLRLRQANGSLSADDLKPVNALLLP